jgi:hypothetical protein
MPVKEHADQEAPEAAFLDLTIQPSLFFSPDVFD